ncbi:MAG: hypothetical protein V4616_12665, partial [Bacteroidota bacterium]
MRFSMGNCLKVVAVVFTLLYAAALDAQIITNSPVCPGGTIRLSVGATGTEYTWSGPNNFTSKSPNPE